MNRVEVKELSIEFLNRAYELVELAEEHKKKCPEESRYLSHGYFLQLENPDYNEFLTIALLSNRDVNCKLVSYDTLLWPSNGNYNIDYRVVSYMLDMYISCLIADGF